MYYNYYDDYQYDSCIAKGICSINPRTSSLREVLVMYLKQLAFYTLQLKYHGIKNNNVEDIILNALSGFMSNLETGSEPFYKTLINLKTVIIKSREVYDKICLERNIKPKDVKSDFKLNKKHNITELIQLGEKELSLKLKLITEENRNLYEIIFCVLKSLCINLVELRSFDTDDERAYSEILYLLNIMNYPETSAEILLKIINNAVKTDFCVYKKLYETRCEVYGEPDEAQVSYSTRPNKAILVTGTGIRELQNVLEVSKDLDIDVYTHGEMIKAFIYPKFREYPHLIGQFGKGTEHCLLDFAAFPGAILVAKHSLESIEYLYRGRLFTTDNFVPQGVIKIRNNDYTPLINSALSAKGFKRGQTKETVSIGCNQKDFDEKADGLVRNMRSFKNIIIIGTKILTEEQKSYFDNLINYLDSATFVISLFDEFDTENFILIKSALDFHTVYKIFERIKEPAWSAGVKIFLFITQCNKNTISNILNLRRLGLDNIYLSKCKPIMLNPSLTATLKNLYDIKETDCVTKDIEIFNNDH